MKNGSNKREVGTSAGSNNRESAVCMFSYLLFKLNHLYRFSYVFRNPTFAYVYNIPYVPVKSVKVFIVHLSTCASSFVYMSPLSV